MRLPKTLLLPLLVFIGCGKSQQMGHEHEGPDGDSTNANRALYDQVMDIHDEVMPKVGDIYELKKKLLEKIASTPNMVAEEKSKLEKRIADLDSVGEMMMGWMHSFQPLPDTVDQERAREYLESEMEKIRKVKEAMLEIIEKEKGSN